MRGELCAGRFKPYYKWIIFNILKVCTNTQKNMWRFKPYYKWIIFNIESMFKIEYNNILF